MELLTVHRTSVSCLLQLCFTATWLRCEMDASSTLVSVQQPLSKLEPDPILSPFSSHVGKACRSRVSVQSPRVGGGKRGPLGFHPIKERPFVCFRPISKRASQIESNRKVGGCWVLSNESVRCGWKPSASHMTVRD
ncbi:hypothetical protein chiPu_0012535 [Chiloscyllium punctatum]|uniref:Secreted protein n=1 Tax=Chiloscyllium punctatum TaxID=137246 RepID=A0A401SUK4_CHIPU|nr:hypothetical protein [Chiloscyllium punctatum]